ncbi:MAG: Serine/threonine protein kinaserelated protein [Planctomycetaceae bacterium]|nr:Serine/threonine protein kinaserelated protein [Planctomycetaceae bacterium]
MSRASMGLFLLVALGFSLTATFAADVSEIDKRVQTARQVYEAENEAIIRDIFKQIDAKEATERDRAKPDLERIKAIKAEREELEQAGKIPNSASTKIKSRIKKNNSTFSSALSAAQTEYLKAKNDEQAEVIAVELETLKTAGLKMPEKPAAADSKPVADKPAGDQPAENKLAGVKKPAPGMKVKAWPKNAPPFAKVPFDPVQAQQLQVAWAKYLKVNVEYTNKIGMKFRLIPPGEFIMGSSPAEVDEALKSFGDDQPLLTKTGRSEAPQHRVTLTQPIYLGTREVTQLEYLKVMGKNPSSFTATGSNKQYVTGVDTSAYPVDTVSWHDAAEFCSRLSVLENLAPVYDREGDNSSLLNGNGYRLPSEAEWEFAARAGTTTKFWCGDELKKETVGWIQTNKTSPVATLIPNQFGIFDTVGNLREWMEDNWEPTWYANFEESGAVNPRCPFVGNSDRVIRGGCFADVPVICRSSSRMARSATNRGPDIGFRVTLPVSSVK